MQEPQPPDRYRFGVFEADPRTGELWRKGLRVRLHAQPFQVLCMLVERPGELLTRESIAQRLWPDGTFVDTEHGVNSAVNRLREALGDAASSPRYIETLARRGYRFVAPVEVVASAAKTPEQDPAAVASPPPMPPKSRAAAAPGRWKVLASAEDLPRAPHRVVLGLFLLFQAMYLSFYLGTLANLAEVAGLVSLLPAAKGVWTAVVATAALLIPVRAYLVCAVLFRPPLFQERFLRLWWGLLVADEAWALSPFLLLHHLRFGVAIACMALLVYAPFVQRSLVLMGAGADGPRTPL